MATEAKKLMRAQFKRETSALSNDVIIEQSLTAQNLIRGLAQYQSAQRIGIYLSMPTGEAQTDHLVRDALQQSKQVFVPVIHSPAELDSVKTQRKQMDMLRLKSVDEYLHLQRDSWGIPKLPKDGLETRENAMGGKGFSTNSESNGEIDVKDESQGLDLIVMPGVAFDHGMNRMGHGAAFYDIFLERFCREKQLKKPYLLGLCLAEQILPVGQELVVQEWDWKVDAVATGDGRLLTLQSSL